MSIKSQIKDLLDSLASDTNIERVVDYVSAEIDEGRRIADILKDPYVKNRVPKGALDKVLADPEVINAVSSEAKEVFQKYLNPDPK